MNRSYISSPPWHLHGGSGRAFLFFRPSNFYNFPVFFRTHTHRFAMQDGMARLEGTANSIIASFLRCTPVNNVVSRHYNLICFNLKGSQLNSYKLWRT
jgi:hypothetical protein